MRPPPEIHDDNNNHIMWKLNKATYGLRSSPRQWQDQIAEVLTALGLTRLKTDSNVYRNRAGTAYIMVYVDGLLFLGEQQEIDILFDKIMKHVLLRSTGKLTTGNTITFLGRNITHNGDHIDISLEDDYIDNILKESNMTTCNAALAPRISHPKAAIEDETVLDPEQHSAYRRLVGKIQWLAYTRPDISYGAKELARSLQAPTQRDNKKLKHMIRYLKGTRHWKHALRPTAQIQDRRVPINIDIYTDANWASCETTRKSTTGFVIHFLGATVHYGSRTAAQESIYISNFVKEALDTKTNIRIHTDSSSAKSIAMREGTSKKAKHIELRYLFTQQLVKNKIITMCKIRSEHNFLDILTKFVPTDTLHRHLYTVGLPSQP